MTTWRSYEHDRIDMHADRMRVEIMRDGLRVRIELLQKIESASRSLGQIRRHGSQVKHNVSRTTI